MFKIHCMAFFGLLSILTWAAEQCHGLHEDICMCTLLRYNSLSEYSNPINYKERIRLVLGT